MKKPLKQILTQDLKQRFPEDLYLAVGPDKHTQEDERIPQSVIRMYENWALNLLEENGWEDPARRTVIKVARAIYHDCNYGIMGVEDHHWHLCI